MRFRQPASRVFVGHDSSRGGGEDLSCATPGKSTVPRSASDMARYQHRFRCSLDSRPQPERATNRMKAEIMTRFTEPIGIKALRAAVGANPKGPPRRLKEWVSWLLVGAAAFGSLIASAPTSHADE